MQSRFESKFTNVATLEEQSRHELNRRFWSFIPQISNSPINHGDQFDIFGQEKLSLPIGVWYGPPNFCEQDYSDFIEFLSDLSTEYPNKVFEILYLRPKYGKMLCNHITEKFSDNLIEKFLNLLLTLSKNYRKEVLEVLTGTVNTRSLCFGIFENIVTRKKMKSIFKYIEIVDELSPIYTRFRQTFVEDISKFNFQNDLFEEIKKENNFNTLRKILIGNTILWDIFDLPTFEQKKWEESVLQQTFFSKPKGFLHHINNLASLYVSQSIRQRNIDYLNLKEKNNDNLTPKSIETLNQETFLIPKNDIGLRRRNVTLRKPEETSESFKTITL